MKYAHLSEDKQRSQTVMAHLSNTATLAADFAAQFNAEEYGYAAGLIHDIGKYADRFQKRLNGGGAYEHSSAGAFELYKQNKNAAIILAYCIAGHHTGLPDCGGNQDISGEATFMGKINRRRQQACDYGEYKNDIDIDKNIPQKLPDLKAPCRDSFALSFFTRMIYSSLVDADFLDTEAFMNDADIRHSTGEPVDKLSDKLDTYLRKFENPSNEINHVRNDILNSCISRANDEIGMFRLTVPTGGGKTLSSAAFAMRHAVVHGMRRIIYVIPYISIIRQTVDVFSHVFGTENVLAHYSTVEYNDDSLETTDSKRLAAENWDAPIVVTTNVQFFESLYGSKSSKCRRIHNIANSVIILDEAQMLPRAFLKPCIRALTELCVNYRCSTVLCTATQPALDGFIPNDIRIRELYSDTQFLFDFFKRVTYRNIGKQSDETILSMLSQSEQVLCIVNSRAAAKKYFGELPSEDRYHLSTYMYPKHIASTLQTIKEQLKQNQTCRVISTSLIEAGVDISFKQVYREIAGVDSIIQAGGRCNREKQNDASESFVNVFESDRKLYGILSSAMLFTKRIIEKYGDFTSPEAIKYYFDLLYKSVGEKDELDANDIIKMLSGKNLAYDFRSADQAFNIIDSPTKQVFIPVDEESGAIAARLRAGERSRQLMQKTGGYSVSLYENQFDNLKSAGALEYRDYDKNLAILRDMSMYSEETGIYVPEHGTGIFA